MRWFNAGVSGLRTSQRALEIISNNIANANTPGYHRQVTHLANSLPYQQAGFSFGTGVALKDISRIRMRVVEAAITRNAFESGEVDARLGRLRLVETQLVASNNGIGERMEALFNRIEELTVRTDDRTLRNDVVSTGKGITDEFNRLAEDLHRMTRGTDTEIESIVGEINNLAGQIARLNTEIQRIEGRGIGAHDLRDQRDQLINDVAALVNVNVTEEQNAGQSTVTVGGLPLVAGGRSFTLEANTALAQATVNMEGFDDPMDASSGRLGGLLQIRNLALPEALQRLDTLAREFVHSVDPVHATGIGTAGPLRQLTSQRVVNDVTVALQNGELDFPAQAGSMFMGVTDTTGSRTLVEIDFNPTTTAVDSFDPASHSLQDVATAIRAVNGIGNAFVNTQTGSLTILAADGYGFDFTGGYDVAPDTTGLGALTTAVPQIGGVVNRTSNDRFTFTFTDPGGTIPTGIGTIGVTPGLTLEVTDQSSNVIATLDVGQGYEAGSALNVADGITVQLSSGNANVGDNFSTRVIGQPDSAGILTALGLNTFFVGSDAGTIGINPDLIANSDRFAHARSSEIGDNSNLHRLAALRDAPLLSGQTQTFREFFTEILTDVGSGIQDLSETQQTHQLLAERLESERQSISGVDPNEELVRMLQYQRMFQFASIQISVVNEALDSLLQIV